MERRRSSLDDADWAVVTWLGWRHVVGFVVQGDVQLDLDVPAGDANFFDDEALQSLFWSKSSWSMKARTRCANPATRRWRWLSRVSARR
jgi:hypothetical protein